MLASPQWHPIRGLEGKGSVRGNHEEQEGGGWDRLAVPATYPTRPFELSR